MALTLYEVKSIIGEYLSDNWSATDIREINSDKTYSLPFIECYFLPGINFSVEMSGAGERYGVFNINVFTKLGVGIDEGLVYSDLLESLFRNKNIDGVICEDGMSLPYTESIGVDENLSAYHHRVIIPFFVFS